MKRLTIWLVAGALCAAQAVGTRLLAEEVDCIQVITPAWHSVTGEEWDFPTPCDLPAGWIEGEPPDSDGDGLNDADERRMGLNPERRDSDGDGVSDGWDPDPTRAAVPGTRYYVDADSGDDSNDGLDEERPWASVQKAAAILTAGDTVYIKNGTYALYQHPELQSLYPANSGDASGGYITFMAYPGHQPLLDGGNQELLHGGLIHIADREYIRIRGLSLTNIDDNAEGIGIYVENARHIEIVSNHVQRTDSSCIQVFTKDQHPGKASANIAIRNNEVEACNRGGPNEMITVAGVDGFEVAGNRIHNTSIGGNGGEGIDIKQGSKNGLVHHNQIWDLNIGRPGIYIDAWDQLTENIDIYANRIHQIDTFGLYLASERGGTLRNVRIYNNLIHDNYRGGIYLADEGSHSGSEPLENIAIINNTIVRNGVDINWYGAVHIENPDIDGLIIHNNLFADNGGYQISSLPETIANLTISNNLLWGDLGDHDQTRIGAGDDYAADPLFASPYGLRLQPESPAIDTADPDYLLADLADMDGDGDLQEPWPQDYAMADRVSGGLLDMGALEYQVATTTDTSCATGPLTLTRIDKTSIQSETSLELTGNIQIPYGTSLSLKAGEWVKLSPSFQALAGSSVMISVGAVRCGL
jgi:hypothetical protein